MHITDLQAAGNTKTLKPGKEKIVEQFLNFHYSKDPRMGVWKPTINAFANVLPPNPYQVNTLSLCIPVCCVFFFFSFFFFRFFYRSRVMEPIIGTLSKFRLCLIVSVLL